MAEYPGTMTYSRQRAQELLGLPQGGGMPPQMPPQAPMGAYGLPQAPMPMPQAPPRKTVASALMDAETKAGKRLTPEEASSVVGNFKVTDYAPEIARRKGTNKLSYEADMAAYDVKTATLMEQYFARPEAEGAAEASGDGMQDFFGAAASAAQAALPTARQAYVDPLVAFGTSAVGGVVGGALGMADYAERARQALGAGAAGLVSGGPQEAKQRMEQEIGEPTMLGTAAQNLAGFMQDVRERALSKETTQAQLGLNELRAADGSADKTFAYLAKNPELAGTMLGDTAAFLTPALGLRLASATSKVLKASPKLAPILASGVPGVGSSGVDFEREVRATPTSELLKNEFNKTAYDTAKSLGLSDSEAEMVTRHAAVARGLPIVMAGSTLANIAAPGIFGKLGLERIAAGSGGGGGRLLTGLAEGVEEGLLAAPAENIGGNVAGNLAGSRDVAATQGLGSDMAVGATMGALAGGVAGGNPPRPRAPLRQPPVAKPPAAATPAAANVAADATAPPAAPIVPTFAPPPGPGLEAPEQAIVAKAIDAIQKSLGAAKSANAKRVKGLETPEDVGNWLTSTVSTPDLPIGALWPKMTPVQRSDTVDKLWAGVKGSVKVKGAAEVAAMLKVVLVPPVPAAPAAPVDVAPAPTITPPAPAVVQTELPPDVAAALAPATPPVPAVATAPATPTTPAVAAAPIAKPLKQPKQLKAVPAVAATPAPAAVTALPQELQGAKPKYSYGVKGFALEFESDIDKALYLLAGSKKLSKSDAKYLAWAKEQTGLSEAELRAEGQRIRNEVIKPLAKDGKAGATLRIPRSTPPPKTEAPVPAGDAGADAVTEAGVEVAEAELEEITLESPPDPVRDPIKAQLTEALPKDVADQIDLDELADAVALAREDAPQQLNDVLRRLQTEGVLTPEQASTVRVVQNTLPPPVSEGPTLTAERGTPAERRQGAEQLTGMTPTQAVDWLRRSASNPFEARVAGYIGARMNEMRALGVRFFFNVHSDVTAKSVATTYTTKSPDGISVYVAVRAGDGAVYEGVVHEFIHAVTTAMLEAMPDSTSAKRLLELHQEIVERVKKKKKRKLVGIERALFGGKANVIATSHEVLTWGLTNKLFQTWMAGEKSKNGSFLSRLFSTVGDMLGVPVKDNTLFAELLSISDTLLTESISPYVAAGHESGVRLRRIGPPSGQELEPPVMMDRYSGSIEGWEGVVIEDNQADNVEESPSSAEAPVGKMQLFIEKLFQQVEAFRKSEQYVHQNNGTVTDDTSPTRAAVVRDSDRALFISVDKAQVIDPIVDWMGANYRRFAESAPVALRRINDFFLAHHLLNERLPTQYAQSVVLKTREVSRDHVLEQLRGGEITPEEARTKLDAIVAADASQTFEEWMAKHYTGKGQHKFSHDSLQEMLDRAQEYGLTTDSMAELNELMQAARQRTTQRLERAGKVPEADPWTAFYGWTWYVPLKGTTQPETISALDYDGPEGAAALKALRATVKTMDGRKTLAESPVIQLLVDLNNAATTEANTKFNEALYSYVLDNQELLRADITIAEGTEKDGYVTDDKQHDHLPKPEGFIYSSADGRTHYIVELPKDSQLLRALTKLDSAMSIAEFGDKVGLPLHYLGSAANIYSRLQTTYDFTWTASVAFIRDVGYMPLMTAYRSFRFPWQAAGFLGRSALNMMQNTLAYKSVWALLQNDIGALQRVADGDSKSLAARTLSYWENGGTSNITAGYNHDVVGRDLEREMGKSGGLRKLNDKTLKRYVRWTDGLANALETITRVAAYDALISTDQDMTPRKAATNVKEAMNYQQSGEWGKMLNAYKVFYRTGATSADAIRTATLKPNGDVDVPKFTAWMGFLSATGFIAYNVIRMMMGTDDEDDIAWLAKVAPDTLTQNLIIPSGTEGKPFKIALGLGLPQLMMAPGVLAAAAVNGDMTWEQAADAYKDVLNRNAPTRVGAAAKGSGVPGALGAIAKIAIPSLLEPNAQLGDNLSPFGSPIRTQYYDDKQFKSEQGMAKTPPEFKQLATWLREKVDIDMFPEEIAYLAGNYGGAPTRSIIKSAIAQPNMSDIGYEGTSVRSALRIGVNDSEFYYQREMREVMDELTPANREYKAAKKKSSMAVTQLEPEIKKQQQAYEALEKAQKAYYDGLNTLRGQPYNLTGKELGRKRLDSKLREAVDKARLALD